MILHNNQQDFAAAIKVASEHLKMRPVYIEKDYWITYILKNISQSSYKDRVVFKGGTSLSKAYNLIQRFSEDVDLAIDRAYLGFDEIPKRKTNLRKKSGKFITEEFYPDLKERFLNHGIGENVKFSLEAAQSSDQDPRIINIFYPNIIEVTDYLKPRVQIEVGCRSLIEPFTMKKISAMVDDEYPEQSFSEKSKEIPSVNPERTFLEKIFLLHEEFQKTA